MIATKMNQKREITETISCLAMEFQGTKQLIEIRSIQWFSISFSITVDVSTVPFYFLISEIVT